MAARQVGAQHDAVCPRRALPGEAAQARRQRGGERGSGAPGGGMTSGNVQLGNREGTDDGLAGMEARDVVGQLSRL